MKRKNEPILLSLLSGKIKDRKNPRPKSGDFLFRLDISRVLSQMGVNMSIEIFCDSSFDNKRKVAGWGVFIKDGEKQRMYSGWLPVDNNNLGEIFAIHTACVLLGGRQGIIYTDSQTSMMYINNQVREKPRTQAQYINHMTMKYWAYKIRKFGLEIKKVQAHQKNFNLINLNNNMADLCAKTGLSRYYLTLDRKRIR